MRAKNLRGEMLIATAKAMLAIGLGQIGLTLVGVMAGLPSPSLSQLGSNLGTTALASLIMFVVVIFGTRKGK